MEGSAIAVFKGGWFCSNDATIMVERHLITLEDGTPASKHTQVIRLMGLHIVEGELRRDDLVEVVFKYEQNEGKKAFEAKVVGLTEEMAILAVSKEIFNHKEIVKKIKGGINYGK